MSTTQILILFNARELATALWIILILLFCLVKKDIRPSLVMCIETAFNEKIIAWLILMGVYVSSIILALNKLSLWDMSLLKDTIFWFIFSAIYIGFQLTSDKEGTKTFKKIILENIGILVFVQYFIGLYTFSFFVEMIIIPVMSIVVMLKLVAEKEEKTLIVAKIMDWFQVSFGLMLIVLTLVKFINDTQPASQIFSLGSFTLPIIMTILFIPFLYAQKVFILYENIFIRMGLWKLKDGYVISTTKITLFRYFGINLYQLKKFQRLTTGRFIGINSLDESKSLLSDIQSLHFEELNGYSFRPVKVGDFDTLMKWRTLPHVCKWWGELKEVEIEKEKFDSRLSSTTSKGYIVYLKMRPIGFIQYYWASKVGDGWWTNYDDFTIGIDQYIAEGTLLNKGHGSAFISKFITFLKRNHYITRVIADPRPENIPAIKCYEKVGFENKGSIVTPDGEAVLMEQLV